MAQDLRKRLHTEGNPLIDGDQATFVWEGESAPLLRGDFNHWSVELPDLIRLKESAPGVWTHTLTLPRDAYIEYTFSQTNPRDSKARVRDPHNNRRVWSGFDAYNHTFDMPDTKHTPFTRVKRGIERGTVTKHILESGWIFPEGKRDLWLYTPANQIAPVPLVVAWDGRDYLRRGKIVEIVDNLIALEHIPPIALALLDSGKSARYVEFNSGEAALEVLTTLALPLANNHLSLIDINQNPGAYGILGASMGGLMAFYAGLRLPSIFGKVISQAGAFVYRPLPSQEVWIHTLVNVLPRPPLMKLWMDVGSFDWLLKANREMRALLTEKGYNVVYREYAAAHNYTAWRDALPDALITLFGQ